MSKDKKNKRFKNLNGFQKIKLALCTTFAAFIGTQFIIERFSVSWAGFQIQFAGTDNITVAILSGVLLVLVYMDRLEFREARDFELKKQRIEKNPETSEMVKRLFKTFFPEK